MALSADKHNSAIHRDTEGLLPCLPCRSHAGWGESSSLGAGGEDEVISVERAMRGKRDPVKTSTRGGNISHSHFSTILLHVDTHSTIFWISKSSSLNTLTDTLHDGRPEDW
jgi:hypothetical protein